MHHLLTGERIKRALEFIEFFLINFFFVYYLHSLIECLETILKSAEKKISTFDFIFVAQLYLDIWLSEPMAKFMVQYEFFKNLNNPHNSIFFTLALVFVLI